MQATTRMKRRLALWYVPFCLALIVVGWCLLWLVKSLGVKDIAKWKKAIVAAYGKVR